MRKCLQMTAMIQKLIRRQILDKNAVLWTRRSKLFWCFVFCLSILAWKYSYLFSLNTLENDTVSLRCTSIDVVYTWVNGSDPAFIDSVQQYDSNFDPARFDDKNELRYSLRSLEKYAPWVRHVYIVTNGQIPHWLDLSYEKVSVIPHSKLVAEADMALILPTFSSSAIETFLHRIPNLSKRFLYLNDDIFLGAPIYPEDLYTEADGVKVFSAWTVPDCSLDCPWVYIGDGACDQHCNIAECQFDGGDCVFDSGAVSLNSNELVGNELKQPSTQQSVKKVLEAESLPQNKTATIPKQHFDPWHRTKRKRKSSFKEVIKNKNLTTIEELQNIVDSFNKKQISKQRIAGVFFDNPETLQKPYKSSKDVYSHSLIHTNMLLNRHYGFKARNVLAHVGFLLDRDVINEMQWKFYKEVHSTALHRFREQNDLQFAFLYYSFLMSETFNVTVEQIFDEFDTDNSMTWSDREVRTFLARMYPLPLDWSAVRYFEDVIVNCSRILGLDNQRQPTYTTLVYERYEDSNVPIISRELVSKCDVLTEALLANFGQRPKYKFSLNSKRGMHSNFMMLTSNISEVVDSLDRLRRNPKKFNCINDNLEPQYPDDNNLIRHLLEDFYLSFFPRRSKFELSARYRNRFTNYQHFEQWRKRKAITLFFGYSASIVLIIFILRFCCLHKAKCVRRYVHIL